MSPKSWFSCSKMTESHEKVFERKEENLYISMKAIEMTLNDLEKQVITRLAEEKLPAEIGNELSLSKGKVNEIISKLMKSHGVKTEVGLIKKVILEGIIKID